MTDAPRVVLILGGYGTFGGRLARLLADDPRLRLIVAGRSRRRAAAFIATLPSGSRATPLEFDRDRDVRSQLESVGPDLVVDASGPFQSYGRDGFRVIEAAIATGTHYLDLADASEFVIQIARFDSDARAAGVFVLSGASTFPALTGAVVTALARDLVRLDSVAAGLAPSPYANVGLNVVRAIASYAGKPVPVLRQGTWTVGHAFTQTRRQTVCVPGRLPLGNVLFSLVDVPDLKILPTLWPDLRDVWVGAGPLPEPLHRAFILSAWLVRLGVLPTLAPLSRLMHSAHNRLAYGEHRGGMFVHIAGEAAECRPVQRAWHLTAEGDDGPLIPSMAAEAIVRRWLGGNGPSPGARPATLEVPLTDYEELFRRRSIHTGRWEVNAAASWPLYRRLLGEAWHRLPPPLRAVHDLDAEMVAEGIATVERGRGFLANLVARLMGLPGSARETVVKVRFTPRDGREIWTRSFGEHRFASVQAEGQGRFQRLLTERFGACVFGLALVIEDHRLRLLVRRWSVCGIPLPLAMAPVADACEFARDGRFHFAVEIAHRLTGRIVLYRGWLVPRSRPPGAPRPC